MRTVTCPGIAHLVIHSTDQQLCMTYQSRMSKASLQLETFNTLLWILVEFSSLHMRSPQAYRHHHPWPANRIDLSHHLVVLPLRPPLSPFISMESLYARANHFGFSVSTTKGTRKKCENIATLVETVCPDIILGTETWLSPDISFSEILDECLGYEVHRNDRPDNPYEGVLIAAKKDLELHDIQCSKDLELISGTVKISKQKKMVISLYYRPPNQSDESYLDKAYAEISKLCKASKKSVFILGGDFNVLGRTTHS